MSKMESGIIFRNGLVNGNLSLLEDHGNKWDVCEFANKGCVWVTNPKIFNYYCSNPKQYCNEKSMNLSEELN